MRRHIGFAVVAVVAVGLYLSGLFQALPEAVQGQPDYLAAGFPASWEGMVLQKQLAGEAALADLDQHHRKPLGLGAGQTVTYAGKEASLTLWVVVTRDTGAAWELADRMTERISSGTARLDPPQALTLGDLVVYKIIQGEHQHYYYVRSDRVYWLAIKASDPDQLALRAARSF